MIFSLPCNGIALSVVMMSLMILQPDSFLAFSPPRGLRLRDFRRDRFFAVEHVVPPLATTTTKAHKQPQRRHHRRASTNGTMLTAMSLAHNDTISASSLFHDLDDDAPITTINTIHQRSDDADESLPVLYTNDPKVLSRWLADKLPMDACAIGFDTESVPDVPWIHSGLKSRPVTVQLSTSKASVVISLLQKNHRYSRACVPLLETVLMDENIIKCGAGIDDDLLDLKRHVPGFKGLNARSRFDVGLLGLSKARIGLKALARTLLHRTLEKPKRLIVSDWSKSPLGDDQIAYAARDAWCGVAVLEELQRLDPDTFGHTPLMDLLRTEPSLKTLAAKRQQRRTAKKKLKSYGRYHRRWSRRVRQQVSKLKQELKEAQVGSTGVESLRCIRVDE